jgi:hypothetical protein
MPSWHLTFSTIGRQRMFSTDLERLVSVRTIARVAGPALRLFSVVDEHAHTVVACERAAASHLASALVRALAALPGAVPFTPTHIVPVNGRSHLITLIRYLVRQPAHHGLAVDAASWNGSCLADLLGARWLAGFEVARLAEDLPRESIGDIARVAVLLPAFSSFDPGKARASGAARLWAATRAAGALDAIAPRSAEAVAWRRAYVTLAVAADIAVSDARHAAGMPKRTWSDLASSPANPERTKVLQRRLGFDAAVAGPRLRATETPMIAAATTGRHPAG